jgi:hypothetical protein
MSVTHLTSGIKLTRHSLKSVIGNKIEQFHVLLLRNISLHLHLTFHTSGKFIVEGTILHFIMTSIF